AICRPAVQPLVTTAKKTQFSRPVLPSRTVMLPSRTIVAPSRTAGWTGHEPLLDGSLDGKKRPFLQRNQQSGRLDGRKDPQASGVYTALAIMALQIGVLSVTANSRTAVPGGLGATTYGCIAIVSAPGALPQNRMSRLSQPACRS